MVLFNSMFHLVQILWIYTKRWEDFKLYLDAVDALVIVIIVHWVVWGQEDAFIIYD